MQNYHSKQNRTLLLCGMVVAFSFTGCATGIKNSMRLSSKDSIWNPVSQLRAEKEFESKPSTPETMVLTWKSSLYEQAGAPKIQGFGGRVFFYDKDNNAVEADGELVIYGFDESNKDREGDKADKKFVFRAGDFQKHKSESGLGVSYSVWVPWERQGGFRKSITLVPVFVANVPREDGEVDKKIIKGGQTINILNGRKPTSEQLSENKPYKVLGSSSAVMNANYDASKSKDGQASQISQVSFDNGIESVGGIKSSTIELTPNMQRRVQAGTAKPKSSKSKRVVSTSADAVSDMRAQIKARKEAAALAKAGSVATEAASSQGRKVFGAPGTF